MQLVTRYGLSDRGADGHVDGLAGCEGYHCVRAEQHPGSVVVTCDDCSGTVNDLHESIDPAGAKRFTMGFELDGNRTRHRISNREQVSVAWLRDGG
jgi:hypothetical protein